MPTIAAMRLDPSQLIGGMAKKLARLPVAIRPKAGLSRSGKAQAN
jgi:hypothetical protein